MPSTTIARGNAEQTFYIAPSIAPAQVGAGPLAAAQTFNVPGLLATDYIIPIGPYAQQTAGIILGNADCYANGVLTIQFANINAAATTPVAGLYAFQIVRAENLPLPVTAV